MPRINHERIVISRKKGQTISKKADERGTKTGMLLESANDKAKLSGAKRAPLSKRRIIELTTMRKQELEYQMAVQNVIGKMIKEYQLTNPKTRIAINITARKLAVAQSKGERTKAQMQANVLFEIIKKEKGAENASSFLRMLQWAVDVSLGKIQKETNTRENNFREITK